MEKLKKYLIPLLICSIFCFIPKTYAATIWNWTDGEDLKQASELYIARCTGQKSCSDVSTNAYDYSEEIGWFVSSEYYSPTDIRSDYQFYSTTNDIEFSANDYGVLIYFRPDQALQQNYMYSLTYYLCTNGTATLQSRNAFTGKNLTQIMEESYPVITLINGTYSAENRPFNNMSEPLFTTCTKYMYTFTSTSTRNYLGIKLNSEVATNQAIYFMGYNLVNLGFTDYAKQDALLSIQESVNSTNSELNGVKDNINVTNGKLDSVNNNLGNVNNNLNNVNSSIKDTQNYLKDDTAPSADINVLGNVQGVLPEGPIDSLLNIPFKVLSILNSSFGGVCVPISGKFVFDSTLTIPCFSDLFYNNVPDSIMIFINVVPTAFILIAYLKNLYKRVDRALSLETSADDEWGGI